MRISRRMQAVQAPVIPIVGDLIRSNPGTLSLGQGVVYYGPPPQALQAVRDLPDHARTHLYGPVEGIGPLTEALSRKLAEENGIAVGTTSRVVVTAGGNMAFFNAVLAICDPGDEVVLNGPYYFNHEMAVAMANAVPVVVPTDDAYQLRPAAIRKALTPRTRAVVTVSPNNPTGAVYPEPDLREINRLCGEMGLYHIHDQAYENFSWSGPTFSPGSIPGADRHTISLFSFSKAYGFAGWRIGYMALPAELFEPVRKIQDTNLICPPVVSQLAAVGALKAGSAYAREKARPIAEIREIALRELRAVGPACTVPPSDGAFYILLRLRSDLAPLAVVERLVREHKVAAIPGDAFGMPGCSLRVAFGALEKSTAVEGIGRLARGLGAILGA